MSLSKIEKMNHFLIESLIKSSPQMRYTKDNQTAIAEMVVLIKGLRNDDPASKLKVLGWGTTAQEMVDKLEEGQKVVLEGRLKMNTITRQDGTKEKQAELTASRIHHISTTHNETNDDVPPTKKSDNEGLEKKNNTDKSNWNSSPLVPEVDEIPF